MTRDALDAELEIREAHCKKLEALIQLKERRLEALATPAPPATLTPRIRRRPILRRRRRCAGARRRSSRSR